MKAGGLRVVSLSSLEKFYEFHSEQILLSINVLDQASIQLKKLIGLLGLERSEITLALPTSFNFNIPTT